MLSAWTGTEMIVWNGGLPSFVGPDGSPSNEPTLHLYDPESDTWRASSSLCEPYLGAGQNYFQWTGARLFVLDDGLNGAYFYDPAADSWQAVATVGGPAARSESASAWTGDAFVIWGGQQPNGLQDSGFVFRP
jgi:N-acetylneuraminic acid mutarotase